MISKLRFARSTEGSLQYQISRKSVQNQSSWYIQAEGGTNWHDV